MCLRWVPTRHFYGKSHVFSLEIGRLLSYVTKKTKNKYLNRLLSIPDSPEDVYAILRLSISTQIVFSQIKKKWCQNNLFIRTRFRYVRVIRINFID